MQRRCVRLFLMLAAVVAGTMTCAATFAWHDTGHKMIASIAFRQLPQEQQDNLAAILEKHPRFQEDFASQIPADIEAGDRAEWLVQQAAVWPDLARNLSEDQKKIFSKPTWHYLDFVTFLNDEDKAALGPLIHINQSFEVPSEARDREFMNAGQALNWSRQVLADLNSPAADRAVALCWLMHLTGDIHQPCHSTALFSRRLFPDVKAGDRGGNLVLTTQHRNLHAVWDGFPGSRARFREAHNKALKWMNESEAAAIRDEAVKELDGAKWLEESHELADEFVYAPEVMKTLRAMEAGTETPVDMPLTLSEGYLQDGGRVAKKRVLEAGYRLGELFKQIPSADAASQSK
jgi:hypothetical protein